MKLMCASHFSLSVRWWCNWLSLCLQSAHSRIELLCTIHLVTHNLWLQSWGSTSHQYVSHMSFSQVFYQINIQLNKLYSLTQRRQHNAHISEDTYSDFYASWNLKTDSQNSYLDDKPHTIVNDLLCVMTLSCNSELWQSLLAKKQHKLENSLKFIVIKEKLKSSHLSLKITQWLKTAVAKSYTCKRKLVFTKLCRCQKLQLRKLLFKVQKTEQIRHHHT
jgi:hypothetical protein